MEDPPLVVSKSAQALLNYTQILFAIFESLVLHAQKLANI